MQVVSFNELYKGKPKHMVRFVLCYSRFFPSKLMNVPGTSVLLMNVPGTSVL